MNHHCIAGIVTYNPELVRLKQNIDAIENQVDCVLIVDNGSENESEVKDIAAKYKTVTVITNGKNMGIAYAMNQIGDQASEMESPFFLTLDQDSVADEDMVEKLLELFADSHVGGVSPNIINANDRTESQNEVVKINIAISSGFIVRTDLWKEIGGFWDYLFIDEVDHEFCFRIREKGYLIVRRFDTCIDHKIGEPRIKNVLGHEYKLTNHSAFRRYYITRNNIIMRYLFPEERCGLYANLYERLFKLIISIILCESDKLRKTKTIIRGIVDGRKWCSENKTVSERRLR